MRRIYGYLYIAAGAAFGLQAIGGCAKAMAEPSGVTSSNLELTVYKDDFAMVHDVRSVQLSAGSSVVQLPNVSKMLDAQSVMFDWPGSGNHPEVTGNTYNLGVGSSQEMLQRMVGQNVQVQWRGQNGQVGDHVSGQLEVANNGTVIKTDSGFIVNPQGEIVAPEQKNLVAVPALVATVQSSDSATKNLGMSYLTRGLSWSADYVASIAPDEKTMRLECWSTITNHTGTDFPTAKVKLVAGSPNRAVTDDSMFQAGDFASGRTRTTREVMATAAPKLEANADLVPTGDFYAYEVPAKADVMQEQMNRAKIFEGTDVPIKKSYSIQVSPWMDPTQRQNAQVSVSFTNGKASGLGQPLPSGAVRSYDSASGSQAYLGAASINDTPKDERVSLTLSNAFDVYSNGVKTSSKRLGKHSYQSSMSVMVHNEKKLPVTVRVVVTYNSPAKVVEESVKSIRLGYDSLEWDVPVPAGGATKLSYTVNTKG